MTLGQFILLFAWGAIYASSWWVLAIVGPETKCIFPMCIVEGIAYAGGIITLVAIFAFFVQEIKIQREKNNKV